MPSEENYFGVRLGEALASGAGSIAGGLERKYELQRREKERQILLEEQQRKEQRAETLTFAGHGFENTPEGLQGYIEQSKKRQGLEMQKTQADIGMMESMSGAGGGGPQFFTGPGNIQYTVTPSKYGPRVQFPAPTPIAINPNTGEQIVLPRGGKIMEPTGSKDAKVTLSKVKSFSSALDELENILKEVPSGRISGGSAKLLNKTFGLFPEVRTAESLGGLMAPMATRIIGGDVGNLSDAEQKAAILALKLANGTIEERKQAINLLRVLLVNKQAEAERLVKGGGMWGQPVSIEQAKQFTEQDNTPLTPEEKQELEQLRAKAMR